MWYCIYTAADLIAYKIMYMIVNFTNLYAKHSISKIFKQNAVTPEMWIYQRVV